MPKSRATLDVKVEAFRDKEGKLWVELLDETLVADRTLKFSPRERSATEDALRDLLLTAQLEQTHVEGTDCIKTRSGRYISIERDDIDVLSTSMNLKYSARHPVDADGKLTSGKGEWISSCHLEKVGKKIQARNLHAFAACTDLPERQLTPEETDLHLNAVYEALQEVPEWAGVPVIGPDGSTYGDSTPVRVPARKLDFGDEVLLPAGTSVLGYAYGGDLGEQMEVRRLDQDTLVDVIAVDFMSAKKVNVRMSIKGTKGICIALMDIEQPVRRLNG